MPHGTHYCRSVFTKPRKPSPHPADNCNHALPVRDTNEDVGDYLPNEYSKITDAKLVWAKPGVPKHWDRNQMPPNVPGRVWEWQEEDNYWKLDMAKREGHPDTLVLLCDHMFCINTAGTHGCVEMSLAQIEAAGGIACVKCCKDQGMCAPPYNYHGSLPVWSLGPVHADPVIMIMAHWQESGKHSMSDLSSKIVQAYLGEMYMSQRLAQHACYVDIVLSEHGATWSADDQPSRQADGMRLICAHIADLVNKAKAL
ncbi:hypothetical protein DACRYDRAFT_14591 [Dacryopinax primogenitus]|uniref:Uncharacterized protein n=1 Tax=Dacryopinax primogenitus (strain DJM 731) TaxID=1858805 RepID=M5FZK2_DACPD|nr:uncharacterized protein DACRYDRAFT_14591 [Dacryopinax primogenitus]EJU03461.1 hypothetical protein DACRYDRAFT_14591 [Dacryopinax primogenitus]